MLYQIFKIFTESPSMCLYPGTLILKSYYRTVVKRMDVDVKHMSKIPGTLPVSSTSCLCFLNFMHVYICGYFTKP